MGADATFFLKKNLNCVKNKEEHHSRIKVLHLKPEMKWISISIVFSDDFRNLFLILSSQVGYEY